MEPGPAFICLGVKAIEVVIVVIVIVSFTCSVFLGGIAYFGRPSAGYIALLGNDHNISEDDYYYQ
ncbi:MAG TPA: hypothetical protein PKC89_11540 [Pyrinomonadaceae bacterium]|nr:hypothetical protein [Pyrinomonadaceae bacterium]